MVKYGFPLMSIVVFCLTAFFMPRRITKIVIFINTFFIITLYYIVYIIFVLRFNLFGILQNGESIRAIIISLGIYPVYGYIFINGFPYKKPLIKKAVYILAHSVFATIFEHLAVKSGYFFYTGWKLWYSALCYPLMFLILALNFSLITKLIEGDYQKLRD